MYESRFEALMEWRLREVGQKSNNASSKKALQEALQAQGSNPETGAEPKKAHRTGRRRKDAAAQPPAEGQQVTSMNEPSSSPSQAEGERETSQENGGNQVTMMDQSAARGEVKGDKPTPSQAEGERDTIEQDLDEKGMGA